MSLFLSDIRNFVGTADSSKGEIFPVGRCKVVCDGMLAVAFITSDGVAMSMFVLTPGTHTVQTPDGVQVVVECDKRVRWSVTIPGRFNPSNPDRVSASLVRPRTQQEEMQDYLNEIVARALGGQQAQQLRSGQAEFDHSQDDYTEDSEDDYDTPLSVHQMTMIMDELQRDLVAQMKREQDSSVPKDGSSPGAPAPGSNQSQMPPPGGSKASPAGDGE